MAWRCSGVNSAAAAGPGTSARIALSQKPRAHKRRVRNNITMTTPISKAPMVASYERRSIVEALRLAVDILGACVRCGVPGQQLLCPGGLLHRILFLAVGQRFLGQRQGGHPHLIVAPISNREKVPDLAV